MIIFVGQPGKKISVLVGHVLVIHKFPVSVGRPSRVYHNAPVLQPFHAVFDASRLFVAAQALQALCPHVGYTLRLRAICGYNLLALCAHYPVHGGHIAAAPVLVIPLSLDFRRKLGIGKPSFVDFIKKIDGVKLAVVGHAAKPKSRPW